MPSRSCEYNSASEKLPLARNPYEESMTDPVAAASPSDAQPVDRPLSQWQRLLYIFVSPGKTFADVLRNADWWLPFVLTALVGYGFTYAVERQVGWGQVVENAIQQSPQQQERIANMTPEQVAAMKRGMQMFFRYISYATPLFALAVAAIVSALLLGTLNFIFAGRAKFGQMMAVYFYATFPLNLKYLLGIIVLFAGMNPAQFRIQNPVGSNLGYYLSPDTPVWLTTLAAHLGIFTLWLLILLSLGSAIVARVKRGQAAVAVVGWWILLVLVTVGWTALS